MLPAKLTVQVQLIMTSMNYDHYDQFDYISNKRSALELVEMHSRRCGLQTPALGKRRSQKLPRSTPKALVYQTFRSARLLDFHRELALPPSLINPQVCSHRNRQAIECRLSLAPSVLRIEWTMKSTPATQAAGLQ